MRELIEIIDAKLAENLERSKRLLENVDENLLFKRPSGLESSFAPFSFGENIVRSAAVIEQAFGGITTRLWDDPFEWTLPEELATTERIAAYINEVDQYRRKGIEFLATDDDLRRTMPAPETVTPILKILLDAMSKSSTHIGQAATILHLLRHQTGV
ncbi:MAG: hypothetical protein QUS14_01050 [Pyrinomonadaceae bacterium]|nr:hypothetical protein [Pyrinomonadaceae bacterium]